MVFKLIRAIHLGAIIKKNLVQFHPFRNGSEIESSMRDTLDHYLKSGKDFRNAMLRLFPSNLTALKLVHPSKNIILSQRFARGSKSREKRELMV